MPGKSEDILGGFRVNWMNLRDADTGKILWQVISTECFSRLESLEGNDDPNLKAMIIQTLGQW